MNMSVAIYYSVYKFFYNLSTSLSTNVYCICCCCLFFISNRKVYFNGIYLLFDDFFAYSFWPRQQVNSTMNKIDFLKEGFPPLLFFKMFSNFLPSFLP